MAREPTLQQTPLEVIKKKGLLGVWLFWFPSDHSYFL